MVNVQLEMMLHVVSSSVRACDRVVYSKYK